MVVDDRYLQQDIKTVDKIFYDATLYDKLLAITELVKELKIESKIQFYQYSQTNILNIPFNIVYEDVLSFERLKDSEYFNYVLEKNKENSNIIELKKHKKY